ncbi:sensor histidine kinase [Peredibacter starrii]|uniref:histidine kinase n=1 Tax=Peredibacter starrii TaxID=28202 RepID=A0AAX4HUR9_9BACT|nr:HAMP domain-containing sensor histidine kinase [Peredibacter starrii]WPU67037.1 HAMP domain-containing sensor histidine kinase [Peredibacter starrii]
MNEVVKYIFFFLIGTTIINFGIAWAAKIKTKNKEFNQLIWYWTSLFATYVAVALLNDSPTAIGFAYFFQFIPAFLKTKVLRDSRGIESDWKKFLAVQAFGMVASAYLLLYTDLGFTISLLPVTFSTTLPYWEPVWNSLVSKRFEANWIEKGLSIVLLTSIINHFNYAFFRLEESAAWWGWGVSIAQYQCISIFLPLLINHRREVNEILIKTVSHDLANPLTVINAYIGMLQSGRIQESDVKMIWDRIQMNTKSALDMISRIRDAIVTRNQASIVAIHDVSIDRAIHRLMTQFDSRLKEKNVKIAYESSIPLDVYVAAEENTLTEHVFANILSNALKFSHEGSEIKIKVTEVDNTIRIAFIDSGIGIDPDRLEKRLLHSTEGTKGELGSGFGVMVMGYFLRQFDGTHHIHSDGMDKGTTVTVSLKKSTAKSFKETKQKSDLIT